MAITARRLTKRYGPVTAVHELDLDAADGRVTGFLGRNGAGKSTTMRCLLGLTRPDDGAALVDGRPHGAHPEPARSVGALLDAEAHHPGRTGRSHLLVLADAAGLPASRVDTVLDAVELTAAADRRVGGYSLGMRQRLHLAAALLGDPANLVLDEPTNGLDPAGIRWLRGLLRALAAEGRCVLLSSHVLGEVAQTVDEVVVVGDGRVLATGTLDAVLRAGVPPAVEVRADDPAALLLAWHARHGTAAPAPPAGPPDGGAAATTGAGPGDSGSRGSDDRGDGGDRGDPAGRWLRVAGPARAVAETARDAGILLTGLRDVEPDLEERFLEMTRPAENGTAR